MLTRNSNKVTIEDGYRLSPPTCKQLVLGFYFEIIAGWTGEAPARSHKPFYVGSIPTPAIYGLNRDGSSVGRASGTPEVAASIPARPYIFELSSITAII